MDKYSANPKEGELLPNLLELSSRKDIDKSEFEGFLYAELKLTAELSSKTKFNSKYIQRIHKLALGHMYAFAGKYRTVNMSKGGFLFPTAQFIPQNMNDFNTEILSKLPNKYNDKNSLIKDIAKVHGEFLFIHPFREGNGRTKRVLANLMVRKQGFEGLRFELVDDKVFPKYVSAVQMVANRDYKPMEEIIELIF
jgi:cell filamentation protein